MRQLSPPDSGTRRHLSYHHVSEQEYELHVIYLSKSKLKQSIATSTLMAGFALVSTKCLAYSHICITCAVRYRRSIFSHRSQSVIVGTMNFMLCGIKGL